MALGIVVSMFTALVVTRLLVYSFYAIGIRNPKVYGRVKEERKPIDFLGKKKSVLCRFLSHFAWADLLLWESIPQGTWERWITALIFVGGTATTVTFDKEYTLEEVDSQMVPELEKITGDKKRTGTDCKGNKSGSV